MGDLHDALVLLGYGVSQKSRVLDCVEAAAADPGASKVGPLTLADALTEEFLANAGPFGPDHTWLRSGDWGRAFKMHFDFVVNERHVDKIRPTHPLFAIEFDGRTMHSDLRAKQRDLSKNRLCAASGLPLLRIDDTFLFRRERFSTIFWLAQLWHSYRSRMPTMLAERDKAIDSLSEEEMDSAGEFLLGEHPELDVNYMFELEHPFPAVQSAATRLASSYGFWWFEVSQDVPMESQWKVVWSRPTTSVRTVGLVERWECELELRGPRGETELISGRADVKIGYPISEDPADADSWAAIRAQRLPCLPAGPFRAASTYLGKALCRHNALVEIEHYLRRHHGRGAS